MSLDPSRLENVKTVNGKTTARCPACKETGGDEEGDHLVIYPDGKFGCVVHEGDREHRQRIFALAGERKKEPTRKAGRTWPSLDAAAQANTKSGLTTTHVYQYDKAGRPFGGVARYERDGSKTFLQFHYSAGVWALGKPSGAWPLYGGVPEAGTVYVVEGEKCQEAAASIGLPVVTWAGGSGATAKTDWSALAGRDVVVLPDNDEPGEKACAALCGVLRGLGARVRVLRLSGLPPDGGDIADWLEARDAQEATGLKAEIERMAAAAPEVAEAAEESEEDEDGGLAVVDAAEYVEAAPPEQDPVIEGVFECGDKGELVSGSKQRKTFFLIELLIHLAVGRNFLGLKIPKRRRVMWVNMELKPEWGWRRIHRLAKALGIAPAELRGWFLVVNARSKGMAVRAHIGKISVNYGVDVVGLDPRYKLMAPGEVENAGEGLQGILNLMDRIAESGPAVLSVHHDPKGDAGDRAIADRGSGSNWAGRDVDARFTLTQQRDEPNTASVVETMCRNYPPVAPFAIRWKGDLFELAPDLEPVPYTSKDRQRQQATNTKVDASAIDAHALLIAREPMGRTELLQAIQDQASVSREASRACVDRLERLGKLAHTPRSGARNGAVKYGLPEAINELVNPRLRI